MRYIAFSKENADFYKKLDPALKIGLCPEEEKDAVTNSNADVAILDGDSYRVLRKERDYRRLMEIYLPLDIGAGRLCKALLLATRYLVRGRLRPYSITTLQTTDGEKRRFLKTRVYSNKTRNHEYDYYPSDWTPMDFLRFLDGMNINYVALRWHDKIINDKPMKDLDILIADEDISKVSQSLSGLVGRKMLHMHSVGGNENIKADTMAYFPPKLSRRILESRQPLTDNGGFRPSDKDYFYSLAYHAVVDKGTLSGLPETADEPVDTENRFYKELAPLKESLGLDVALNLDALATFLEEESWLPPADRIAKFAIHNPWLKKRISSRVSATENIKGDYTVFLLRDIVREWGILPELRESLKKMGFNIIFEKELTGEALERAAFEIRGGNWTSGAAWPASAGKPFYVILVHDPKPLKMSRKQMRMQPFVRNARLLEKAKWREKVNSRLPKDKRANFVHASDNTHETHEYLSVVAPEALDLLK